MRAMLIAALLAASPAAAVEYLDFDLPFSGNYQTYEIKVSGGSLVDAFVQSQNELARSWWENFGDEEPNWVIWGNEYIEFGACESNGCGALGYLRNFSLTPERLRFTFTLPTDYQRCPTSPKIPFAVCGESRYNAIIFGTVGYEGEPGATLSISAVPEPAAWATMIVGFGLAGAALRRRPQATTA
jgi:hypothetical protein